ncbi:MAG: hypothetical protein K6A74_04310 [Lachnospiraceae bacterium]|nr:hypothetical protein [Lachnospiraceae bacterium]
MARFDFCPKCGALARDGVCTSCGYKVPGAVTGSELSVNAGQTGYEGQPANDPYVSQNVSQTGYTAGYTAQPQETSQTYQAPQTAYTPQTTIYQNATRNPVSTQQYTYSGQQYTYQNPQYTQAAQQDPNAAYQNPGAAYQNQNNAYQNPQGTQPYYLNGQQYYNPGQTAYGQPGYGTKKANPVPWLIAGSVVVFMLCIYVLFSFVKYGRSIINSIPSAYGTDQEYNYGLGEGEDSDHIGEYDPDGGYDPDADFDYQQFFERYGNYDSPLADILAVNEEYFGTGKLAELTDDPYSGKDPNAYEFDNYVDTSAGYTVSSTSWVYDNSNGRYDSTNLTLPHYLHMSGNYIVLSNTGLENEDEINRLIYERSVRGAEIGEEGVYYTDSEQYPDMCVFSDAYITYMDKDVLSIMFYSSGYLVEGYGGENEEPTYILSSIYSINIDMKTGKEILASETFDFGGDFVQTFKDRCLSQNGAAIDYFESDEELEKELTDDSKVVWAYTPLGLEVGVNRPGLVGWSTGTFTDYSALKK